MSSFCDSTTVELHAGNGGNGFVHFHSEKFVRYGGPDGGDGGRGGSIIFKVNENLNTLTHLDSHKHIKAEDGENGHIKLQHGKDGTDLILEVPRGTLIYKINSSPSPYQERGLGGEVSSENMLLVDLSHPSDTFTAARGGRGGFGNAHFKSSVRQAPDFAELGEEGEIKMIRLELKLMADVAIIGIPSAGKSTLISVISNAKPKIANYPFTTLIPNLGVVTPFPNDLSKTMVIADIPGLIEGASEGKGLGHEFLKHVERSRLLIHLVDPTQGDPIENFNIINTELKKFNPELAKRPQIVVINKVDALDEEIGKDVLSVIARRLVPKATKQSRQQKNTILYPHPISSATTQGTKELVKLVYSELQKLPSIEFMEQNDENYKIFRPHLEDPKYFGVEHIEKPSHDLKLSARHLIEEGEKPSFFQVHGQRVEQIANMTDWNNREARIRVEDVLQKMGIERELRKLLAQENDIIFVGDKPLRFKPKKRKKENKKK